MQLTDADRLALMKVLDFRVSRTRKNTPRLLPMSLYSSELKGREQIAGCLKAIRDGNPLADTPRSRDRYFNSLHNQGLADGTAATPKLAGPSHYYLDPLDRGEKSDFWQGDGGDSVELEVIRALAATLQAGGNASDAFKLPWYGAQIFFDYVPDAEVANVLADKAMLLFLFHINSNGWEIARYFQLSGEERQAFKDAFAKIQPSSQSNPTDPIEIAAANYKDAAQNIQADVRFRISGFLKAYNVLREELGSKLPRLDRSLVVRTSVNRDGASAPPLIDADAEPVTPLKHPHQLIVTGCPGSGKSYYVDRLTEEADYVIRTQFHPESTFFDFVGAYKPQPVYKPLDDTDPLYEGDGTVSLRGKPLIDYRFVPGPFMCGLTRALDRPDENVVVLIEELNRGNTAAIFGDILQLLDRGSDGYSRYEIEATPEQRTYFASVGLALNTIRLPPNLYLWATMNSADQGVFPLDTAFRRRWSYVYKGYTEPCEYPSEESIVTFGGKRYSWDSFRKAINDHLIENGIHEDKLVGPYFLTIPQLGDPDAILQKLFLYLWDDVLRFRQDSLFTAKSFSEVSVAWAASSGAPLNLILPEALMEPPSISNLTKSADSASQSEAASTPGGL
ncbi:AAA family ATPase [Burkholderia ambifaria]|uniref:AAA family ATPase n=1 Tax=Burkholderia ambifaria TaxID=152480 RepID=UPI001B92EAF1|nr:AAA family ATPase [Burkholderia ambifaria]MBR8179301.1 AAA family ATPase [Burkholderia ambifaria]